VGAEPVSAELAQLAEEYWQADLRASPVQATVLGDRRYDHLLSDNTPEGQARRRTQLQGLRQRAAGLYTDRFSKSDRVTHSMLLDVIDADLAQIDCNLDDFSVDPLGGPQTRLFDIPSFQPVASVEQARAMVQRWQAMGGFVDQHVRNLRRGLAAGRVATQDQVRRVVEQIDEQLAKDTTEWSLLRPSTEPHADWNARDRDWFAGALRDAVEKGMRPALQRYRDFLVAEVQPVARDQAHVGVGNIPSGPDCYRSLIRLHTTLDLPPEEIHAIGQREVARIMAAMQDLGARTIGTKDLASTLHALRTDSTLYFDSRDAVEAKAREALQRATAAIPKWFGILPQAPCEVVRMEPHEEKHSTIAYYRQPAVDGSRPGSYYINTYAPETRPRYEAEALAFHEAIPGHHLQIAIAQELKGVPEFRKHSGATAFVEGWALYTERLSDEMGLYSGDLDRIGMLSYEAWRACRLVVDTGMHALGWSRKQAIDFMLANSALAENNIVNEVDRYITWPGQALAYKLGQLEILKLREESRKRAGADFDIREFHDVVLRNGAVSLATLRGIVTEHYAAREASR
jgi:uncharacterized protein (DUF885 family)